jgi:N6-adenosine-specific RNA methylase IME4
MRNALPVKPAEWPERAYKLAYVSPSWGPEGSSRDLSDLMKLPVPSLLLPPAVVLLWVPGGKLEEGLDLLWGWKLHYRGVAFVWVKTDSKGVPLGAHGPRPTVSSRGSTELVLAAETGPEYVLAGSTEKRGRPLPIVDETVGQVVMAPVGPRPPEVRARIERMYGSAVSRVELFAPGEVPGWDVWAPGAAVVVSAPSREGAEEKPAPQGGTEKEGFELAMGLDDE